MKRERESEEVPADHHGSNDGGPAGVEDFMHVLVTMGNPAPQRAHQQEDTQEQGG
jgi:hypothetical protein